MKDRRVISTCNRYKLPKRPFWAGFFYFIGIEHNPYERALRRILRYDTFRALKSDIDQLKADVDAVMQKHHKELNSTRTKALVNAGEQQ